MKRQNGVTIATTFMLLTTMLSLGSLLYISSNMDHHCTGNSSCGVCKQIDYAQHLFREATIGLVTIGSFYFMYFKADLTTLIKKSFRILPTLIDLKVRLDC